MEIESINDINKEQALAALDIRKKQTAELEALIAQGEVLTKLVTENGDKMHERDLRSINRVIDTIDSMKTNVVNLVPFLRKQPTAKELSFKARESVLVKAALKRLTKSRLMFASPVLVLDAVNILMNEHLSKEDILELRHRLIHYIDKMNLTLDGPIVAVPMGRLTKAAAALKARFGIINDLPAEDKDLVVSAQAALSSFLYAARNQ